MFEIVQSVKGSPNPSVYDEGLSYTPELSGAAMVVYWEFLNEEVAKKHIIITDHITEKIPASDNPIWSKYRQLGSGLDIFYIKQLTPEEELEVKMAMARVLYKMYFELLDQETFERLTGLTVSVETLTEPTAREKGLFYKEINEIVAEEFYCAV
ncbi:MAG: hypothetical protein R3B60_04765 [Candidatus Paceibacterota bacterium]